MNLQMGFLKGRQSAGDKDNAMLIARLDGRAVKYVTERDPIASTESVIGREGRINTKNQQITIVCNGTEVFRCASDGARCGELLSLGGVVIRGVNAATGKESTVVAYYQYYR